MAAHRFNVLISLTHERHTRQSYEEPLMRGGESPEDDAADAPSSFSFGGVDSSGCGVASLEEGLSRKLRHDS